MALLDGKTGLIFGVANKRSIAWGISQALAGAGARLAFTYQERVGDNVKELASILSGSITMPCDVQKDDEIQSVMDQVDREFGGLDILVHSVAFAPKEALDNPYLYTSREAFHLALDISAYSLTAMTRLALPLMQKRGGGSVITMTFGGDRVFPNYNVMGVAKAALESSVRYLAHSVGEYNIRVNAISAGPVKTLAARGIQGFMDMYEKSREITPLKRNIEVSEIGNLALFLCSDMSSGITGEVIFCDAGFNIMGLKQ